jgi:Ca-activated chloride channel family protein
MESAAEFPVSTFSIDVDTGSYANVRRMLRAGRLPVQDAVRVEELVNYFSYDYPRPKDPDQPFLATTEIAPAPWNPDTYLLQVGIQGYEVKSESLPPANLVFLVDVSGSMQSADKLGLLKSALKLLTRKLRAVDHVAIAVYAGASGVVLEPTTGNRQFRIRQAIESLQAGGSTNGAAGIALAYELAAKSFQPNGVNRVLLATDGDFNVGTVDFDALIDMVEARRKSGIALTTLGFGTGNYNDHLMEQLADAGNGNHAYIDTLQEAQKVLVDEAASTLHTIARDVKIQIEFNPALVSEYRLIGYENRLLNREDFNNDRVDAGEIGAGHSVTALYEVALAGRGGERVDPLRYAVQSQAEARNVQEVAMLRIRYKTVVDGEASRLIETPVLRDSVISEISGASGRFRFAAAVAAFAQHLRGGTYLERFGYPEIGDLARNARGRDRSGYRGEFLQLLALAQSLDTAPSVQAHATAD